MAGLTPVTALASFAIGYFAFISLYEIGYIFNDFVSVKFEKDGRRRLEAWAPSNTVIAIWILIRIVCFGLLTSLISSDLLFVWFFFFGILMLVFMGHNLLRKKEYKVLTFMSLAMMRFYAPIFVFMPYEFLRITLPAILLFYVFFRTLTYMDSKGLLNMPGRATLAFKMQYYLLLIPLSAAVTFLVQDNIFLYINLYFLIFWLTLFIFRYAGLIQITDIKSE